MSFEKAAAELVAELQTLDEIRQAPDGIPEDPEFPFAAVMADNGLYQFFNDTQMRALHNIMLQVHVVKEPDMDRSYRNELLPLLDKIPMHLKMKLKTRAWSTIQTWEQIDYDIGPGRWYGINTLMIRYTIRNVKVIDDYV